MEYSINLTTFQGPFDLLFYLIEKKEVDIYDIPIAEITDQYLKYLDDMKQMNLNITSEFILMAATLIEIKSQMLLPSKNTDEEDPRLELVNQLLEYKACKYASEKLKEFESKSNLYFTKPKEDILVDESQNNEQFTINGVSAFELYNIFIKLLKEKDIKIIDSAPKINKIYRESYSTKDCVDSILIMLRKNPCVSVFSLFEEHKNSVTTKEYVVSVFLAVLELSKMKNIKIYQEKNFSDIQIISTKE